MISSRITDCAIVADIGRMNLHDARLGADARLKRPNDLAGPEPWSILSGTV
jgi:hypothetical protein